MTNIIARNTYKLCACVSYLLRMRNSNNNLNNITMSSYWLLAQTLRQLVSSSATQILLLLLFVLDASWLCYAGVGYSYTRFVGPVTGPEQKVLVRDAQSGIDNVDYIAHPRYHFAYGIEDAEQRLLQNRKETRDGDNLHGVYSVMDPDGTLRVVKYMADNANGFQAEVITNGVSAMHGNNEPQQHWNLANPEVAAYQQQNDNDDDDGDAASIEDNDEYEQYTQHDEPSSIESTEEDFDEDGQEHSYEVVEYEQDT